MLTQTSGQWSVASGQLKPRLELRRDPDFGWTWFGLVEFRANYPPWRTPYFLLIGTARYLTVADALDIYWHIGGNAAAVERLGNHADSQGIPQVLSRPGLGDRKATNSRARGRPLRALRRPQWPARQVARRQDAFLSGQDPVRLRSP